MLYFSGINLQLLKFCLAVIATCQVSEKQRAWLHPRTYNARLNLESRNLNRVEYTVLITISNRV
ncbi:hypothetical protein SCG7086_BQ_00080 [Chlamydiales bacterium SCGC AG-110-P3]|nr:hypothetical protein SCG7086_BQ_00080 [Chlamydiales bacterium SCGC AG-110-P3]